MRLVSFQEEDFFNELQKIHFKLDKIAEQSAKMQAKAESKDIGPETEYSYNHIIEQNNQIVQMLRGFLGETDTRRKSLEGFDRHKLLKGQKEWLKNINY